MLARCSAMDDDETIIGNKIIEKVGLPLVNGYAKRLGSDVLWLKKRSLSRTLAARDKEIAELLEVQKISYYSQELERLLISHNFFSGGANWRLPLLELLEEVRRVYPADNQISMTGRDLRPVDVNEEIASLYQDYFGKKPAYSYSELHGYTGPFWNFVRSLREDAGMDISEAAIRKANQRKKRDK